MRLLKLHRGQTVSVHLDDVVLRGVLMDSTADSLSLREVTATGGEGVPVDLPGPVVVPTLQVLFVAVIP